MKRSLGSIAAAALAIGAMVMPAQAAIDFMPRARKANHFVASTGTKSCDRQTFSVVAGRPRRRR